MAEDLTTPDPTPVLDLVEGFRRSKVLFAAVELGVFDLLKRGCASLETLASQLGCQPQGLERLLDACVHFQLLTKESGIYANTPAAATYLCQNSPRQVTGYIRYSNKVLWKLWDRLENAVREGSHRWPEVYGWEGPIFDAFFQTPESQREFLLGMHGYGVMSSPMVVSALDLSRFKTLVDLGGATGHLAVAACTRYPHLNGIVFDLPSACPLAEELVAQSPVANRVRVQAGDFFVDTLPEADLFALGRIVHDWSEDKILLLLRRVYDRLPSGGAILLAEKLLWDDKTGPRWALLQSLNMLVCTEGKERNLGEYEQLLTRVGFERVQGMRTNSPLDAVWGWKP
ncbi:MAG: class I SAM-dependent methyltransferase [Planctomycetaceae bacterium]